MTLPRARFTVHEAMAAAVLVGVTVTAGRGMGFSRCSHSHRHQSYRCGCERPDLSRLTWPGRCLTTYHSGMAALYGICAAVYGQPPVSCGVPVLDPIPGESAP